MWKISLEGEAYARFPKEGLPKAPASAWLPSTMLPLGFKMGWHASAHLWGAGGLGDNGQDGCCFQLEALCSVFKILILKSMTVSAHGQPWIYVTSIIIITNVIVAGVMAAHLAISLWDLERSLRFP